MFVFFWQGPHTEIYKPKFSGYKGSRAPVFELFLGFDFSYFKQLAASRRF